MSNASKRLLVLLGFAGLAAGPFLLFFTSGLSFYTYHALSGMMAIKHQVAHALGSGEYPLWNPFMLNGAPFHSGIGILDPLLVSYVFLDGLNALLFSSYLALFAAGLGMYLYLHKQQGLSIAASVAGGGLYLLNPFFAATSHELPFMAPAVYLPWLFWCYDKCRERGSVFYGLLCAFCLSLTFFSGNLQSFYFILLFFLTVQVSRWLLTIYREQSFAVVRREGLFLGLATLPCFLFAAVDLLPTLEMIPQSGRAADAMILQNAVYFAVAGFGAVLLTGLGQRRAADGVSKKRLYLRMAAAVIAGILFLIHIDWSKPFVGWAPNLWFPDIGKVMLGGQGSYELLRQVSGSSPALMKAFLDPRFVFYIQPPIYLFSMPVLILLVLGLLREKEAPSRLWGWLAVMMAVFPYTAVPNAMHYLFRMDEIAYPRMMFGFFFLVSALAARTLDAVISGNRASAPERRLLKKAGCGIFAAALVGAGCLIWIRLETFDPGTFRRLLQTFASGGGAARFLAGASGTHDALTRHALSYLLHQSPALFAFGLIKYAALFSMALVLVNPRPLRGYLLIFFLLTEALFAWNFYTFQKRDVRSLTTPFPETTFFETLNPSERVGTLNDPEVTLWNFYGTERALDLGGNFPLFWNVRTVEGAALNLSPQLFRKFWALDPRNSFTPTVLNAESSLIYDLMGLRYLYTDRPQEAEHYRPVREGKRYRILENEKALPRFYFSKDIEETDENHLTERLTETPLRWEPAEKTLVEAAAGPETVSGVTNRGRGKLSIQKDGYNELIIATESEGSGFLATTEAYDPRWKVFVDGAEQAVIKTNYYFRGVFLTPGRHEVHFLYLPGSFQAGAVVSVGAVLFLILTGLWESGRRSDA